jgi:hypothetical protein
MLTLTQYKQIHNIEGNEFPEFLDVISWKENNRKNRPRTTNNSDTPNYIPPTKLEILSQVKKEYAIKVKIYEEGIRYYTIMRYDERKLYLNRKFHTKYILKLAEVQQEFEQEFKKEFENDINFNIFNDL